MDFASYLDHFERQCAALRAAAVQAGPETPVPTCPEWTVLRLIRHLGRVHAWATASLSADPDGPGPERPTVPAEWNELLPWWDDLRARLVETLRAGGQDAPAWVFVTGVPSSAAFWARRQAHEVAIHRLDAEHALAGSSSSSAIPTLVFDPEFAADGIDEVLTWLVPRRLERARKDNDPGIVGVKGMILFHAADAGRAWLVRLQDGKAEVGPVDGPAVDTDATVAGTADAVYRAAWHRPSTALIGGDHAVRDAVRAP